MEEQEKPNSEELNSNELSPEELEGEMPENVPQSDGEMPDSSYMDTERSSNGPGYSPSNNFRRNQNEYHGRQYYKDQYNKASEDLDRAKQNRDAARAEKSKDTKSVTDLDQNGNAKWKDGQAPKSRTWENGKETTKGAPTKEVEKTKQDKKEDKKKAKEANKEYKDAKRAKRQASFDRIQHGVDTIRNPGATAKNYLKDKATRPLNNLKEAGKEKAKEGAKKAGQAAAKSVKKAGGAAVKSLTNLILKLPPPVLIGIGVAIFLFLIIMFILGAEVAHEEEEQGGLASVGCSYSDVSVVDEGTYVRVVSCDENAENGGVIMEVPLEKYIGGVVLNEVGRGYNSEVLKAELVLVRSHLLAYAKEEGHYNSDENVIIIKQCEATLDYWDYGKDLYVSSTDSSSFSNEPLEGFELSREAFTDNEKVVFETDAKAVACRFLTDVNGNIYDPSLSESSLNAIYNQATTAEGTENGNYNALLLKNYPQASNVSSGEASFSSYFSGDVGEYSGWKQLCSLGSPWCGVCMGSSCPCSDGKCKRRINEIGCAVTSVAMLIAHSGLPTDNVPNFNPGSFVEALRKNGVLGDGGGINNWDGMKKVVPGFVFKERVVTNGDISKVKAYADQGYYIVMEVKTHSNKDNKQHYVAVNNAASSAAGWSDIYIWDPAQNITKMSNKKKGYSYRANKIFVYEVKK